MPIISAKPSLIGSSGLLVIKNRSFTWLREKDERLSQVPGQKELLNSFASDIESTANKLVIVFHIQGNNETKIGKFMP